MMKLKLYMIQKVALALSITIVLNLLFNYGIYTFYPSPKYDDYCTEETRKYYDNKDSCEQVGGAWVAYDQGYPRYAKAMPVPASPEVIYEEPTEYCDASATCRKQYEEAQNLYTRNVFIALVILGTISVALGFFLIAVSAISSGFLFGGLVSLFIGTTRYWSDMNDFLRLVVLVLALFSLIWIGYKKLKDK